MPDTFSVGQVFKRLGKISIRIREVLPNKKYRVEKVVNPLQEKFLLERFEKDQLFPGSILDLEDRRRVQLIKRDEFGYWSSTYPNDFVEISEEELQLLELDETK